MQTLFHLSDFPRELAKHVLRHAPNPANSLVVAPCCGRRAIACTIADLRNVRETIVAGGGFREPQDHDWLCDGCRARMFALAEPVRTVKGRKLAWTESSLLEARGAPAHMVQWHRAAEWEHEMMLQAFARNEEHQPTAARELAIEQIDLLHRRRAEADAMQLLEKTA